MVEVGGAEFGVGIDGDCGDGLRDFMVGELGNVVVGELAVVDAEFVEVAAAVVVVGAFDAGGRDDAGVRAELVERGVEEAGGGLGGHELAVDVETDAGGFIPGKCEVDPLVGLGKVGSGDRDAGAAEVDVGDEGIETVAVVVDAEPGHIPGGVVAEADAEDGELGGIDGCAGTPEEAEGAALGVDVSGSPVGEQLVIAALQVGAFGAAREDFDVLEEVRVRHAASGVVGFEAVVAGEIEEQAGFG